MLPVVRARAPLVVHPAVGAQVPREMARQAGCSRRRLGRHHALAVNTDRGRGLSLPRGCQDQDKAATD